MKGFYMNKDQLTIMGLSAYLTVQSVVFLRHLKKHRELRETANLLCDVAITNDKQNDYFRHLLDEHEIPVTEFDKIALNFLRQGE